MSVMKISEMQKFSVFDYLRMFLAQCPNQSANPWDLLMDLLHLLPSSNLASELQQFVVICCGMKKPGNDQLMTELSVGEETAVEPKLGTAEDEGAKEQTPEGTRKPTVGHASAGTS